MQRINRPIGGFIELDRSTGIEFHDNALRFNLGRTALAFAMQNKHFSKIYIPYYVCDSICEVLSRYNLSYEYYHIDSDLKPIFEATLKDNEAILIVNYFGSFDNKELCEYIKRYKNVIIDNTQAFFADGPVGESVVSLFTCRKWLGVPDGAYLSGIERNAEYDSLPTDNSWSRQEHLLRKFEDPNVDLYEDYSMLEKSFSSESIKKMSTLTQNRLKSIDYDFVSNRRLHNWTIINSYLNGYSETIIKSRGIPFMYALCVEKAGDLRRSLKKHKIYLPTLWPNVLALPHDWTERKYAENLLLLPIDQRYNDNDMIFLAEQVSKELCR